jgi:hypothetical protein
VLALQTNEQIGFVMNGSNIPDGDGLTEYREAHAFQKLVDSQRKRCGLSGRQLAERIGVSQSTLWIWLHNLNGYPLRNLSKNFACNASAGFSKLRQTKSSALSTLHRHPRTSSSMTDATPFRANTCSTSPRTSIGGAK